MSSLKTTLIDSISCLSPYLSDWQKLSGNMPMRSPEWLLTWWQIYAMAGDSLSVLVIHDPEGTLIGLAPLYLQDPQGERTFRLLGVADDCTHHADWLAASGWEVRVGDQVAQYLIDNKTKWKCLFFESVDADAKAIHATVDRLARDGLLCHRRKINSSWKISLPGTWDDYLQMLSRSLRKRCRKLQRQFFNSDIIKIRQVETEVDLQAGFNILLRLHAARWGNEDQPLGVFSNNKFRRFHEKICKMLLARNQLRMAWLECEGKPIAIEYQFFDQETVFAYQAGIDLSVYNGFSPGKLTMMAAIRFAIERGCRSFDLLCGDNPYKAHWRAVPTPCHDLRVWPQTVRGYFEWGMWKCYTLSVQWLKPVIPESVGRRLLKWFAR